MIPLIAYKHYTELPIDFQEHIWRDVIDSYRQEHILQFGEVMRFVPNHATMDQYDSTIYNLFYREAVDYVQYRNIRDYLQSLADTRKLVIYYGEDYHEVCISAGYNFDTNHHEAHIEDRPQCCISRVFAQQIMNPLYDDSAINTINDEFIPRSEIPPNLPGKELVSFWFAVDFQENKGFRNVFKFPINIDEDLIVYH